MPGVFRPYTLVDVLGTMNEQGVQATGNDIINGLGDFGQTNEIFSLADAVTLAHQAGTLNTWDNVAWGAFTWS